MKIKSASLFISEKNLGQNNTGAENDGDKKTSSKISNFQDFVREP